MRFSTYYPTLKPKGLRSFIENRELALAIIEHAENKTLTQYGRRYETERYASMAIFPWEQLFYQRVQDCSGKLRKRINTIDSIIALDEYLCQIIGGLRPLEIAHDVPLTFFDALIGKLRRYYFC